MPLRINTRHHSQPEGGWSYAVEDGPSMSSDKIGEPGLRDLIRQLSDYRKSNGFPIGDPEHDIALKYALRCPWLILDEPDEIAEDEATEQWIHFIWRSFPQPQPETREREERFAHCEKCMHFVPLETVPLSEEAMRRLMLLNPAKERKEHGWCMLHKWIPSVIVQIQDPTKFTKITFPVRECWLHFKQ